MLKLDEATQTAETQVPAVPERHLKVTSLEIDGLRLKRRETETSIESIISTPHHTLAFVSEQREEKVVPHRPRIEGAGRPA